MTEKLKVLDLFAGYTICEDGTVMSRFGRVIKPQVSNVGYIRVELWQNGKGRKYSVHRLLAQAFIPNLENKPQVNHINGVKSDNALSNLEWVTQSENQRHAYAAGLQKGYCKPGQKLSAKHKAALCGSRWAGEDRKYICNGVEFASPEAAASSCRVSRQTVYNRSASPKFPDWLIVITKEVRAND